MYESIFVVAKILITFAVLAVSLVGVARDAVRLAPVQDEDAQKALRLAARSAFTILVLLAAIVSTIIVIVRGGGASWGAWACVALIYLIAFLFVLARIFSISDGGAAGEGLGDKCAFALANWVGGDRAKYFVVGRIFTKSAATVGAFYLLADFVAR